MEKRTIGGFIAALRKANGMTQKDLAEKLNVSDKTVSRWEREDSSPDLSVIPVIAEIFGVTCDELLRGERKPLTDRMDTMEETTTTPKGEKQRQRILMVSLTKYKTRSFIAMGITIAGFIVAMIGNFGFLRANLGFLIGAVFYLASIICQAIFMNHAFLSVADDSLNGTEIGQFKKSVIHLAEWSFSLTAVTFGATLPLVVYHYDTYVGLSADTLFPLGAIYGVITLLLCNTLCYFLNAILLKKGIYTLNEKEAHTYHHNHTLKRKCSLIFLTIFAVTLMVHLFTSFFENSVRLSKGTKFYDYESFVTYMEQDLPYYYYNEHSSNVVDHIAPQDSIMYYDALGNEISEEEALRTTITDSNGNVVCEYRKRNETVSSIHYTEKEGNILPITVITYDDLRESQAKITLINLTFVSIYFLEAITMFIVYFKKRIL